MQYQTPQFIEVEDKIFGPLTLKQFIYVAGGGGLCLLFLTLLPTWLAILLSLPVVALALALAFYEINGRPFVIAIEHALSYQLHAKLFLWRQREPSDTPKAAPSAPVAPPAVPRLSQSKLRDLSWSLNIKDRSQEDPSKQIGNFQI